MLALAVLSLAVLVLGSLYRYTLFGEPGAAAVQGSDTLTVARGSSAYDVAAQLASARLIEDPRQFVWFLKLRGLTDQLKAGVYLLPRSASSAELASLLTEGRMARTTVTFPEGWTAERMAARLQAAGVCDSTEFVDAVRDSGRAHQLGFPELATLDGLLFPETYVFVLNTPGSQVASEMVAHFIDRMGEAWVDSARADKYGLLGILTLASIVEGEINLDDEADDVAAVYRNRLLRGMKLEADPTVQYLLPEPRRLLFKDLEIDSPYNTYRYRGLPPGPINNPGEPALRAAVHPPEHPWLYMVATGDGGHTFTTTYDDHLRAKARFDAHRRQVARQQRR